MTMKQIGFLTGVLVGASLFAFSLVLHYGKGGSWWFPTCLAVGVILATGGFVLMLRAQRAESRGH